MESEVEISISIILKFTKTLIYLFLVFIKTGYTNDSKDVLEPKHIQPQAIGFPRVKGGRLSEKKNEPRYFIFPNATWKNARGVCLNYNHSLLLAHDHEFIKKNLLPVMDSRDFVWISTKDYGFKCRNNNGLNSTDEKTCESYIRVNLKPSTEKLNYGICEWKKNTGIERLNTNDPVTWSDMENLCTSAGGKLYNVSAVLEGWASLSILRPNKTFWVGKYGPQNFPDFDLDKKVETRCIGLVKLTEDTFIYMAEDCYRKHNFICDNTTSDYAPAVEVLGKPTPFYLEEEVEKAMTDAMSHPHPTQPVDSATDGPAEDEPPNIAAILGPVFAAAFALAIAGVGLYCFIRIRNIQAYRKSLFRYETKKATFHIPAQPCRDIIHLDLPDQEATYYGSDNNQPATEQHERKHDDVYYERRYEPLQREVVNACSKKLNNRKDVKKKEVMKEEHLNQLMMYDPLRKDSFLSSGHASSCGDGLNISYERYDPDSIEMQQQLLQNNTLHSVHPKYCTVGKGKGSGGNVSYLKQVKTLDDLDQYENSNSLQEKRAQLVKANDKLQKTSGNTVKRLKDLDQYENYNLPPLPQVLTPLPTKKRPKKATKTGPGISPKPPRPDCYENHDLE